MGRLTPCPNHADTIWRKDIEREIDALARFVDQKLTRAKLEGTPDHISRMGSRKSSSPYDSGIPRPTTSVEGSFFSRYEMLTPVPHRLPVARTPDLQECGWLNHALLLASYGDASSQ